VRDEVLARLLELNRRRAAGLPDLDEPVEEDAKVLEAPALAGHSRNDEIVT
jgi:hypothetical protein